MFKHFENMRKQDLDTGMVVETRCGMRSLVLRNGDKVKMMCLTNEYIWYSTEDMEEDMTVPNDSPSDIVKVLWPDTLSIQGMRSSTAIMWKRKE